MTRADSVYRGVAKAIDFIVVGTLATIPSPIGALAGALYILISDGFFQGQSIGKKLVGLRVRVQRESGETAPCSFRESMVRNLPFSAIAVLASIPFLGWLLFFFVGIPVLAIEAYFSQFDDQGIRIGDIFAHTQVVDAKTA